MKTFILTIITPSGIFHSCAVDFTVLMAFSGELGILPGHAPVIAQLVPGTVRYTCGTEQKIIVIAAGFAYIRQDAVTVLTTLARYTVS